MTEQADRFLVTGSGGCIGAWAVSLLVRNGVHVTAFDVNEDRRRLRLTLDEWEWEKVTFRNGDIRSLERLVEVVSTDRITHVVHLAALQVPFCKADPVLGSQVNVTGTVNVLEAVRRSKGAVRGLSYASSIAVFGPAEMYAGEEVGDDAPLAPTTLYGAYKQANEWTARIYAADWGIRSIGLRPSVVYGPGRDQGLTSDPTKAMVAAVAGREAHVAFGGAALYQHAEDVARCFIAAAQREASEASVYNIPGHLATTPEMIALIEQAAPEAKGRISADETPLPLPARIDGSPLLELLGDDASQRPLGEGVAGSVDAFRRLLAAGLVDPA